MKGYIKTLLVSGILGLAYINTRAQIPIDLNRWALTFSDEFNTPGNVDQNVWGLGAAPAGAPGWAQIACKVDGGMNPGTNAQQGIDNSFLRITTKPENYNCAYFNYNTNPFTIDHQDMVYTTAQLTSKSLFRFGYYEIRCKLPVGYPGIGPNFWLWGNNHPEEPCLPKYREIDVFEYSLNPSYSGTCRYNVHFNNIYNTVGDVGYGLTSPHGNYLFDPTGPLSGPQWNNDGQYHTYGVEWTPDRIIFYKDGTTIGATDPQEVTPTTFGPMYIVVDVNVAGVANMDPNPHYFDVDYVRVYKRRYSVQPLSPTLHAGNEVWGSGYEYKVANTFIKNGASVEIIAENNISLQPGFMVEPGGKLNARIGTYDYVGPVEPNPDPYLFSCITQPQAGVPSTDYTFRMANDDFNDNTEGKDVSVNSLSFVSPNPTAGKFHLDLPASKDIPTVTISNILGEKVYQSNYTAREEIDLSKYENGTYIIRVHVDGITKVQKIILNK